MRPLLLICALLLCLAGCETIPKGRIAATPQHRQPLPALSGSYHQVRRGDTLGRIARSYGLDVNSLAAVNHVSGAGQLEVGQTLFIPLPQETRKFLWPLRGSYGRSGAYGVTIAATAGSLVRASRSGRVAVATHRLSGWGKTVVLDHFDGYLSVYAGLEEILVAPGSALRQGIPIGNVGSRPLYFEVRYGTTPKDTLALLPTE